MGREGEGGREGREGPVKSVKPRACKVASAPLLMAIHIRVLTLAVLNLGFTTVQSSKKLSASDCNSGVSNCNAVITIAIRLRYDESATHSTTTEVIEITIRLRYDYDVSRIS